MPIAGFDFLDSICTTLNSPQLTDKGAVLRSDLLRTTGGTRAHRGPRNKEALRWTVRGLILRRTDRRTYASASLSRTPDNTRSEESVPGCVGPKTRRSLWTTSCMLVSASSRSSPVLR